jgi:hypothetical protein
MILVVLAAVFLGGYSGANPKKVSFGKAFAYVLVVWIVYVLIVKVALVAAFA